MSRDKVKTIQVVSEKADGNPHGYVVINECDKTDEQELFVEPGQEPVLPVAPVVVPTPAPAPVRPAPAPIATPVLPVAPVVPAPVTPSWAKPV